MIIIVYVTIVAIHISQRLRRIFNVSAEVEDEDSGLIEEKDREEDPAVETFEIESYGLDYDARGLNDL